MAIELIKPITNVPMEEVKNNVKGDSSNLFSQMLNNAINNIQAGVETVDEGTAKILAGADVNLDEFVINLQKAEMSLNLTLQVRDKLIDAYKEIMRMQI